MKIKSGVILHKLGESYLAYQNDQSVLHELNETAYDVLILLKLSHTEKQLIDKMAGIYEVDRGALKEDIKQLVIELAKLSLIEGSK